MNRFHRVALISLGVCLAAGPAMAAKKKAETPRISVVDTSSASERVRAVPGEWIITAGATLAQHPDPSVDAASAAARQLLTRQGAPDFSDADVEQLALLVLQQAARSAEADLKLIMDSLRKQNEKKKVKRAAPGKAEPVDPALADFTPQQQQRLQVIRERNARLQAVVSSATESAAADGKASKPGK